MKMYCILKNIILVDLVCDSLIYLKICFLEMVPVSLRSLGQEDRNPWKTNKHAKTNKQIKPFVGETFIWEIFRQGLKIFFFLIFFRKINMAYVISTFSKKKKKKEILKRNKKTKKN